MADLREEATDSTRRVTGESVIPEAEGAIERVFIQPEDAPAYPDAVKAILAADLIVIGPGSLFTSILPNLLVKGITGAIRASKALKVYVCNVATQRGETESYTVADHIQVIERHVGKKLFDAVLINDQFPPLKADANFAYVRLEEKSLLDSGVRVHGAPLSDPERPWRHNSERLGKAIGDVLENHLRQLS
jgi:uncharacterized cofD-like protein